MKIRTNLDLLVLGGGIAGLWTAEAARQAGYRVVLLESQALGAGQTLQSQGIIHAGLKYALLGQVNETAQLIAAVAKDWDAAMRGEGAVDLRGAKIAAPAQYMLVPGGLLSTIAGAIGHAALGETIQNLKPDAWPKGLSTLGFKGNVIAMHEPGLEIHSVLHALVAQLSDVCYVYDPAVAKISARADGGLESITVGDVALCPQQVVAVAAHGNEWLAQQLNFKAAAQHRPLKMVLLKGDLPHAYWHGVGGSFRPAFTISTHRTSAGKTFGSADKTSGSAGEAVWYIGGAVAENVDQDDKTQFDDTATALQKYLPKLDLKNAAWASLPVTRVEGYDPRGWLPDRPSYQQHANVTLGWVNKLTLAPLMAREILEKLAPPSGSVVEKLPLPPAQIANNPWDNAIWQQR